MPSTATRIAYVLINVRDAKPREQVQTINSYGSLIRDAIAHGGSRVLVANLP